MCDACDRAEQHPLTPRFNAGCLRCSARMIAHGQDFWRSAKDGKMDPGYSEILKQTFGFDIAAWHAQVKDWERRIHQAKQWAEIQKGPRA
jgi:hypothetical protein